MHLLYPAHFILQIIAWLIALAWLSRFIEAARGLPGIPDLTAAAHNLTPLDSPTLTVIVPARNEAIDIADCLLSLLKQDYPNLRILAVNDRSTDGTGDIIDEISRTVPERLGSLHVDELPPDWLGKTHAMAIAARHAITVHNPDYLLFTDADIVFDPEMLRRAMAHAAAVQADHLVILPTTLIKARGEAMLLSYLQVMGMWAVRSWRVADPGARDAIGVGAFNLIRTKAYVQLGGFEAISMEVVEDMALGRRVKAAGLRQRVAFAPGMVTVHWAAGVFGIVNNMTKNIFAVFRFRPERLLGAALWFGLFCIGPVIFLALSGTRIPAVITLVSVAGLYILSSRASRLSAWNAVLFPVSAALVVYSMLRSMVITLRDGGVTWRGTFYPLIALRVRK